MKYPLRKIRLSTIVFLVLLLVVFALGTTSFYLFKAANGSIIEGVGSFENVTPSNKKFKSGKIKEYVNTIPKEQLVEELDINEEVSSVVIQNENTYESHIFDYESGEEISIDDILKEGTKEDFNNKVSSLLYLKYPKFIADALSLNDHRNVYILKENELIIYYYDYIITPVVNEVLSLKVNYNEIKDFINIDVNYDLEYQNEDGNIIDPSKKMISITFDDGPSGYTKSLVDTYTENHAHATFFMVGNRINNYASAAKYVYDNGNEIGYHSWAHQNMKREEITAIQEEYQKSTEIIKNITGEGFSFMRPPYGAINEEIANSLDTAYILWDVDTEDWRHHDQEYLVNYVLEHVNDGDIILFHDIHKDSVECMKKLLPELYVRGYQLVTVTDLATYKGKTIENHKIYRSFK